MNLKFVGKCLTAAVLSLGIASAASASIITFDIAWSGLAASNNATGTGFFTLDDTKIVKSPNGGFSFNPTFPSTAITDLQVTIAGATLGNGTFKLSDFSYLTFSSPSSLDFSKELIGQSLSNGCKYGITTGPCSVGSTGDFNLFTTKTGVPTGTNYFRLTTQNAAGQNLFVTSIAPRAAVPEPTTVALLSLGLLGVVASRRKSAKSKNA
jgi:hypothetical protein